MNIPQTELEIEIQTIKAKLQNYEDTDPAYMNEKMKELRHFTLYTHLRMEESLGYLLIRNQLEPLGSATIPKETYQQAFASGTTIAMEIDFARKVELAKSCGQIDKSVGSALYQVNDLRKWFSHPAKYYKILSEFRDEQSKYKNALGQLVQAHEKMNEVFKKYLPENSKEG